MKPKTKFQKKVVAARKHLRPATAKQIAWGFENCFEATGIFTKHKATCMECGHQWKQRPNLLATIAGHTCPNCGKELQMRYSRDRKLDEIKYYSIVTVINDFQVVRTFHLTKYRKIGEKPVTTCTEVTQQWMDETGKYCLFSMATNSMFGYYDKWVWGSEIELRDKHHGSMLRSAIEPDRIYPRIRVLPEVKRNGFNGSFYQVSPFIFMERLLRDSRAETLLKANQISMLKYMFHRHIDNYWHSIKICIRNGYIIEDASIWADYFNLLKHFNKDLLSSHYVCPVDLKGSHDKLVAKRRAIQEREWALQERAREIQQQALVEQKIKDLEADQVDYENQKGRFFGMAFGNGNITVKVLETVREFMEEGDALNHCVFTNSYYSKPDSLVMSARIDGKPVETIELSLSSLKILQSRGHRNQATEHHAEIIDLVGQNMRMITARMKQIPA